MVLSNFRRTGVGKDYILKLASATEQGMGWGLYLFMACELQKTEPEEFAYNLAGASTNYIMMRTPTKPEQVDFGKEHADRAQKVALNLCRGAEMHELLSGAFYNIGYGRYIQAGGGQLFNHYLAFIRAESQHVSLPFQKLNELSVSILEPWSHLKKLGMWIPRGTNPNELAYFNAVQKFAEQQQRRIPRS